MYVYLVAYSAEVKKSNVARLPIKKIDNKNKKKHDQITKHVDSLLRLYEDLRAEKKESGQDKIKRQIIYHENQIDELVYQLYELTPEEIKIVRGE